MRFLPRLKKLYGLVGFCQCVRVFVAYLFEQEVFITPNGSLYGFKCRPRGSDLFVMEQVFGGKKEGQIDFGVVEPDLIIDGGANIGLTSAAYAMRFPHAKIVAVEPDDANFSLLKRNVSAFPNVFPLHAAIWSRSAKLRLENPKATSWSRRVGPSDDGEVVAVTIPDIIASVQLNSVDVVKLDIEGAEAEVFKNGDLDWMLQCKCLIVEVHGKECMHEVLSATKSWCTPVRHGEKLVFYAKR
jgi:FkbM family methyltransferase